MKVKAEYTALLRKQAGTADEEFDLPEGATVADLTTAAGGAHCETFKGMIAGATIVPFVNGAQADAGTALTEGAVVTYLSPISGG